LAQSAVVVGVSTRAKQKGEFAMGANVKKSLKERLQAALQELEQLDARLQQKADYGPGKGDPAIYDWEYTLARRKDAAARLETIRQAIAKCSTGRYGLCERCGLPIDPERLQILPLATLCIACARLARP
jgi:DnaK suppressor protein